MILIHIYCFGLVTIYTEYLVGDDLRYDVFNFRSAALLHGRPVCNGMVTIRAMRMVLRHQP